MTPEQQAKSTMIPLWAEKIDESENFIMIKFHGELWLKHLEELWALGLRVTGTGNLGGGTIFAVCEKMR